MRNGCAGLAVSLALIAAPSAVRSADECAPWPGEFSPLPTVESLDPMAAEWARLRAAELLRAAREREAGEPVEAYRLYARIRCLDPYSAEASAGLERVGPRLVVVRGPRSPPRLSRLDGALARAEELIAEARFRDALESLSALRTELGELEPTTEVGLRRVRLEVLEATTWVAFGDAGAAQESLERALFVDPQLEFDERSASPKLRRALEAARRSLGGAEGES
ncbi:MAG: hypothetical protein ACQGVK_10890 [Myxococcota bacterium]